MKNPTYLQPKKQFGQNFLTNENSQRRVKMAFSRLLEQFKDKTILEIGPGRGDMTEQLLEFEKAVLALEIDREAVAALEEKYQIQAQKWPQANLADSPYSHSPQDLEDSSQSLEKWLESEQKNSQKITLLHCDALELIIQKALDLNQFVLFSSLPYNVGSRILAEIGQNYPTLPFCVIVQREVARKVLKTEKLTFFGAWLNLFWNLKIELPISPGNFFPPPKVHSSLLVGLPKTLPSWLKNQENRQKTRRALHLLFSNPKKTLGNNLTYLGWERERIHKFLEQNNLSEKERLSWQNYEQILFLVLNQS